jgi:hypothetical protein
MATAAITLQQQRSDYESQYFLSQHVQARCDDNWPLPQSIRDMCS